MAAERRKTTLLYSTGEREDDFIEQLRWVLPLAFLGSTMLLIIAVVRWWQPWMPGVVYLGMLWGPLVGVLVWRCGLGNRQGLMMAGVCLAAFSVPLLAWNSGLYREAALWGYDRLMPAELPAGASSDRSDRVATLACELAMGERAAGVVAQIRDELDDRPEVASTCLESVVEVERGAAIRVARHLQEQWYQGWLSGAHGEDSPLACREVAHFRRIGEEVSHRGTPELLHCSVEAANEEVARCCAEILNERVSDEEVRQVDPDRWLRDMELDLFRALASDLSSGGGERQMADTLRWSDETLYYWANELGCYLMEDGEVDRRALSRRLSEMTAAQCRQDAGADLQAFSTVGVMGQTCADWRQTAAEERSTAMWCEAVRESSRTMAVDTASFLVDAAAQRYGYRGLRGGMERGWRRSQMMADRQSVFSFGTASPYVEGEAAGTAGIRLQRPEWTQPRARDLEGERAMDDRYHERRQEAQEEVGEEAQSETRGGEEALSQEAQEREAARRAGRGSRDAIDELRQQADESD